MRHCAFVADVVAKHVVRTFDPDQSRLAHAAQLTFRTRSPKIEP